MPTDIHLAAARGDRCGIFGSPGCVPSPGAGARPWWGGVRI